MKSLVDEIFAFDAISCFPRLELLRKELLEARPAICVERARLVTEYFRLNGFDESRPVMRQARCWHTCLTAFPSGYSMVS